MRYGLLLVFGLSVVLQPSCSKKKRASGTCAEDLSGAELADSTKLADDMLKVARLESSMGKTFFDFIDTIGKGIKSSLSGDGTLEIPAHFSAKNGDYAFTIGGEPSFSLTASLYYPESSSKAGQKITDNLFAIDNYVKVTKVNVSGDNVEIIYSELGPLSELIGFAAASTPSPHTESKDNLGKRIVSALEKVQIGFTITTTTEHDGRQASITRTSGKQTLREFLLQPVLRFDETSGSATWAAKGQTLTVDKWTIAPSVTGFGASGSGHFTVAGDPALGTYKGEIVYDDTLLSPIAKPSVTLLCPDDTLAKPKDYDDGPFSSFLADLFSGYSQDAKSQWQSVSDHYSSQVVTCENPDELLSCINSAIGQVSGKSSPKVDLAFLFDVSGSMWDEIDVVKAKTIEIVNAISQKLDSVDAQFGLVVFSDDVDPYTKKIISDFTADATQFKTNVESVELLGGGDYPEAALEGAYEGLTNLKWRDSSDLKIMIGVSDATFKDPGPEGITLQKVFDTAVEKKVVILPILMGY